METAKLYITGHSGNYIHDFMDMQPVIVVTHARVPHGIYWLSSDLGPRAAGLEGKCTT